MKTVLDKAKDIRKPSLEVAPTISAQRTRTKNENRSSLNVRQQQKGHLFILQLFTLTWPWSLIWPI